MATDMKVVEATLAGLRQAAALATRQESDRLFKKWILLYKAIVTGNLYRSVKTRTDEVKDTLVVNVDVADYGILVNAGGVSRTPKPFAYAAVRELAKTLLRKVAKSNG